MTRAFLLTNLDAAVPAFQVSSRARHHRVFDPGACAASHHRPKRTVLAWEDALREGCEEQVHQQEQHTHRKGVFPGHVSRDARRWSLGYVHDSSRLKGKARN
jgi:hypothetical protein